MKKLSVLSLPLMLLVLTIFAFSGFVFGPDNTYPDSKVFVNKNSFVGGLNITSPSPMATTLINPAGDGGFETGSTFSANGWTLVNGTATSAQNQWYLGTSTTAGIGSGNVAYITNNTTTGAYAYTNNSANYIVHYYRDVTFPAGETIINLSFTWKGVGESTAFDGLQVSLAPTSVTPTAASTAPSGSVTTNIVTGATYVGNVLYFNQSTGETATIRIPESVAGNTITNSTKRLIFTFRMDGFSGTSPATAIDNILLTSRVPVPLSGTYTINNTLPTGSGNYLSFTDAINNINIDGISGPVTFNVSAGQTFTEDPPIITATGTSGNPVVFQKSGAGANPVIKPTGVSASNYAGICIKGGDYITFDGIDITKNPSSVLDYGYYILNNSTTDGAQYNTIKNTKITLNRVYTSSRGIYQNVASIPSSSTGANSYNRYYNLTIENVYAGINLVGHSLYPDEGCEIGTTGGGSTIIGGSTANDIGNGMSATYGISTTSQKNIKIFNTEIRNVTGTSTNAVDGIYMVNTGSTTTSVGTCEIYNNKIHDIGSTSTSINSHRVTGIRANLTGASGSIGNIYNNFIYGLENSSAYTSGRNLTGIFIQDAGNGASAVFNVSFNNVRLAPTAISNINTCFEIGTTSGPVINVRDNIFANFTAAQTGSAKHYTWVTTSVTSIGNTGSISNYNDLYVSNSTNGYIGLASSNDKATLADWKGVASNDANSVSLDPLFISGTDLHIANSSLYGAGTAITGITTDIDGQTRANPPSIGADEITLSPKTLGTIVYNQVSTADVYAGTANNPILRIDLPVTGNSGTLILNSLVVTSLNTSDADIAASGVKLFRTSDANFSTSNQLGTAQSLSSGTATFSGLAYDLQGSVTTYLWITYDISASPTNLNVVDAKITANSIDIGSSTYPAIDQSPSGSRTIKVPLSGIYTIDNTLPASATNYTSFTSAVNDLNNAGISGAVTFNVTSGQTFTEGPINMTRTGTVTNTVTFQKSGGGANPIIKCVGTAGTDAIIKLNSVSYYTFNGIDLSPAAGSTEVEFGYYLLGTAAAGCQYNNVKNSTITLDKSNTISRGVYLNSLASASTGANSYNKFYNNTVQNASNGYYFTGSSVAYDDGNEIGNESAGTSTITNIGGSSTAYLVYINYQTNNKVFNTTIQSNFTSTGTIYGLYSNGSNNTFEWYGNTVKDFNTANNAYAVYVNQGSNANIYNNTIQNINITSTSKNLYGIFASLNVTTANIYGNTISGLTTADNLNNIYGIYILAVTGNIYNNSIYSLTNNGASPKNCFGIYLDGTTNNAYNNYISDINEPFDNSGYLAAGIYSSYGTARIYYNTVYLKYASLNASNNSAALYSKATATSIDLRNNIFVNAVDVTTGARAVAFYRSATGFTNIASTSNNNLYYAGTPGSKNLIFYDGTNSDQTLTAYKTRIGTMDQGAVTELPPFINVSSTPYNLHLSSSTATQVESGGQRITAPLAVTNDYDGDLRWGETGYTGTGTLPDIGADEFNGIPIDKNGPDITYTALGNATSTTGRVFSNVSITDPSGVNVTAGTAPRVYFKKSTNANTYAGNTSSNDGWKWVETNVTEALFSFNMDYSLIYGGVVTGDVIQYFVVAQDNSVPAYVGINSGAPNRTPASVDLTAQEFPIGGTINQYTIASSITGVILVGTGQTYTSLTANNANGLFKAINEKMVTGNITVNIVSDLSESGAVALNQATEEALYTITIQPNDATVKAISGNYAGGLIRLNGADGVTFDGRFGGSGNYLTFSNTSTSGSAVFQLISLGVNAGASNNTIRNCNIISSASAVESFGVAVGGSTLGTYGADNDNVTIRNNTISGMSTGIYSSGTASVSSGGNDNLLISQNTITINNSAVSAYGIKVGYGLTSEISSNTLDITTSYRVPVGISIEYGFVSSIVSRNLISKVITTDVYSYFGSRGITVGTGTASSALTISNNVIYGVNGKNNTSFSYSSVGIGLGMVGHSDILNATTGGVNLYYNSVSMNDSYTNLNGCLTAALYVGSGASALDIRNNIFSNFLNNYGGVSDSKSYSVYSLAGNTAFTNINFNDYYPLTPSTFSNTGYVGYIGSADKSAIADWRTGTGQDVNSIQVNPSFVNKLQPSEGSPVLAAGTSVSVTVDYTGAARNGTAPSIGAYENPFILPAPDCAVISSPSNSAVSVLTTTSLNWTAGGDYTTGYKLSFGTDNPPTNILNNSDLGNVTNYDPPGDLQYATTYYWKVTAYNNIGEATGCNVWSFTTQINPNYGSNFQTGNNLYYFANSTPGAGGAPSQPTFNWIDPSGGVTLIENRSALYPLTDGNLDDGYFTVSSGLPAGSFRFFGNNYTTVNIGTNGYVSFGAGYTEWNPSAIPSAGTPNNAIYGLWCDLRWDDNIFVSGRKLMYKVVGNDLVITYLNAPTSATSETDYVSFQIILTFSESPVNNSDIKIQFDDSQTGDGWKNPATGQYYTNSKAHLVGIEGNGTAGTALQYRFVSGGSVVTHGPLISSPVAIAMGSNDGVLPVTLSSFTNTVNNRDVKLNWVTASEINNAGFEVQRADNSEQITEYKTLGYIAGNGTTTTQHNYTFEDKKLNSGKYNYRLRQVDNNGNYKYYNLSNQVEIGLPSKFVLSQNYPNPFNPSTKIDFALPFYSRVNIVLYDITGREVKTLVNDSRKAGYYTVQFNASDLTSGVYFYRIMTKSGTQDFVMTKKMMLIK